MINYLIDWLACYLKRTGDPYLLPYHFIKIYLIYHNSWSGIDFGTPCIRRRLQVHVPAGLRAPLGREEVRERVRRPHRHQQRHHHQPILSSHLPLKQGPTHMSLFISTYSYWVYNFPMTLMTVCWLDGWVVCHNFLPCSYRSVFDLRGGNVKKVVVLVYSHHKPCVCQKTTTLVFAFFDLEASKTCKIQKETFLLFVCSALIKELPKIVCQVAFLYNSQQFLKNNLKHFKLGIDQLIIIPYQKTLSKQSPTKKITIHHFWFDGAP